MTESASRSNDSNSGDGPRLLGAYAAKQCPYKLFRENDPTEPAVAAEPDDALQDLFDGGIRFEAEMVTELVRLHGSDAVAIPGRGEADHAERRKLTDAALTAGTPIILGALMQPDPKGRRMGEIDILLATGETTKAGKAVYRPIDVKSHRCTRTLDDPEEIADELVQDLHLLGDPNAVPGYAPKYREDDCLQLAHYYRLLRTHGHALRFEQDGPLMAGILGMEGVVAWFDLNAPKFMTLTPQEQDNDDGSSEIVYHRRGRAKKRTALSRYNFEFAFRLKVLDAATKRTSRGEEPMVLPVSVAECNRCPWREPCHADMEVADDVSLVKPVGYPEWRVHRFLGVETRQQLADLDLDTAQAIADGAEPGDLLNDENATTVAYGSTPISAGALVTQIECARAAVAGQMLTVPGWDDNNIPRGDIEIDFDLENAERVYMWGTRISKVPDHWPEQHGGYLAFTSFSELDDAGEAELVAQLWHWLDDIRQRAATESLTVRVYGYSVAGTEAAQLRRIVADGASPGLPSPEALEAFIESNELVDLWPLMKRKYWSNWGHGLKAVAKASGFEWRDEDPGGFASIGWYHDAVAGIDRAANIDRLVQYNEDDCAATAALRT